MEQMPYLEREMMMLPKSIDSLPNELLRIVLAKVNSVEPLQVSIMNRAVSKRWKTVIEDIFRSKQSFVIRGSTEWYPISSFSITFNGLVHFNKKNSAVLLVSQKLSQGLLNLLVQLFPQVQNLVMASQYITTGSLSSYGGVMGQLCKRTDLHEPFNGWTSVKRVHLEGFKYLLPGTMAQLEHCSLDSRDFGAIVPHLSSKCTSLYLGFITLPEITQLINACSIVNGITRLAFQVEDGGAEILPVVGDKFAALQVLIIGFWGEFYFNANSVTQLAKLGQLSCLTLNFVHFDLVNLARSNLATLNSVQTLSLTFESRESRLADAAQFDEAKFCRVLASIFTGLRQLTIKHSNAQVRNAIGEHLNRFVHLRQHEILADDYD